VLDDWGRRGCEQFSGSVNKGIGFGPKKKIQRSYEHGHRAVYGHHKTERYHGKAGNPWL